jgi:acyl-CoA thioesterase FadM
VTEDTFAWSAPYRVRFDEAGPDGLLRTSVLLRYAQDVAWFHSASRGYDRAWYAARGLTWLVRAAEVSVLERVAVGSDLVGTTRVVGWRRVWARRKTTFRDAAGTLLARADIDWVLLDARGAPTRIPAEFEPIFGTTAGSVGLARVALGEPGADARQVRVVVRPQELDPMDHVNNAVYADWLEEAVIGAGDPGATRAIPRLMRLDYASAADPDAHLVADIWPAETGWAYRLRDEAGHELLRARLERARPVDEPILIGALADPPSPQPVE